MDHSLAGAKTAVCAALLCSGALGAAILSERALRSTATGRRPINLRGADSASRFEQSETQLAGWAENCDPGLFELARLQPSPGEIVESGMWRGLAKLLSSWPLAHDFSFQPPGTRPDGQANPGGSAEESSSSGPFGSLSPAYDQSCRHFVRCPRVIGCDP